MSHLYTPNSSIASQQVPDKSILDLNGRQTYLGNSFAVNTPFASPGTTNEITYLLLTNPSTSKKSMFSFSRQHNLNSSAVPCEAIFRYYAGSVVTPGSQTVALVADVAGSLNSKYFLLNDVSGSHLYYVWFNINAAGVDPAVPGRTGIQVAGATGATAATLGAAMVVAINAAAPLYFLASGTSTVTITNIASGGYTAASDGAAATGFTFAALGTSFASHNLRINSASPSSDMLWVAQPNTSSFGSLIANSGVSFAAPSLENQSLVIVDPGVSILITVQTSAANIPVSLNFAWYEL